MNIEGANLSMLSGNNTVGSGAGSSFAKTDVGNEFADAFKDQIKLSKTANNQAEMSRRDVAESQKKHPQNDVSKLQANKSDDDELAALLGNESTSSDKTDADTDLESALAVLTDTLKPAALNKDSADTTNQQNISDVIMFNGLPFAQPPTEEPNQGNPNGDISLDDILQNKIVFLEPGQDTPETDIPSLDSAEPAEKTALIAEPSKPEPGNTSSGMNPLQQPVDNRTEYTVLTKPLNHPGWSKDLGEHILWLYNKAIPSAEITLNPEHLGPISVRIDVNQDQASILFTTQHAATKEALEASIPKLREMLNHQQLNLAEVNISQHSASNQQHSSSQGFTNSPEQREQKAEGATDAAEHSENGQAVTVKGLLSLYA